jgi:hypothetical protein
VAVAVAPVPPSLPVSASDPSAETPKADAGTANARLANIAVRLESLIKRASAHRLVKEPLPGEPGTGRRAHR